MTRRPRLTRYFAEEAGAALTAECVAELNDVLSQCHAPGTDAWIPPTFFIEVDEANLAHSVEAWLHVTACPREHMTSFVQNTDGEISAVKTLSGRAWHPSDQPELVNPTLYPFSGFAQTRAILIWSNSD